MSTHTQTMDRTTLRDRAADPRVGHAVGLVVRSGLEALLAMAGAAAVMLVLVAASQSGTPLPWTINSFNASALLVAWLLATAFIAVLHHDQRSRNARAEAAEAAERTTTTKEK